MFLRRPLAHPPVRAGIFNHISRIFGPRSDRPLHALFCSSSHPDPPPMPPFQNPGPMSGFSGNNKGSMPYNRFPGLGQSGLSNHGTRTSFPRSLIDSGNENEVETGKNSKSMDIVRGLLEDYDKGGAPFGSPFRQYQVENDPDIVHVKLLRNNTFITVTDSKGNKKFGASAGKLASGGKVSRFAAESTAEHVGREARNRNLKSVVMKVNGFTYFRKKKQSILSFKEGYNHSRGDVNPVVYIEDTTRRPHNGCRLRKKRRI
ncbi:probable ribosomal protein S11, mitochondrial isoform X1 [Ipomoea triloba]|uniref:probable ribosomal protein S11, mitochondrial isoform X1 n=1 Tax=Ipomoea triloba TaxID=35885 RepID=UPI00125CF732|nr:probable ribosomal protein S11, mitochondrial isoform X1 [Ipomoea triloba]